MIFSPVFNWYKEIRYGYKSELAILQWATNTYRGLVQEGLNQV
jgi:hypothetical protein